MRCRSDDQKQFARGLASSISVEGARGMKVRSFGFLPNVFLRSRFFIFAQTLTPTAVTFIFLFHRVSLSILYTRIDHTFEVRGEFERSRVKGARYQTRELRLVELLPTPLFPFSPFSLAVDTVAIEFPRKGRAKRAEIALKNTETRPSI